MSHKIINILFLGGAKRVSLAERFKIAGKALGCHVNIFSYELTQNVPISAVGNVLIGLKWDNPDVYTHLQEIIETNSIHIVLPFVDTATKIAAKLKEISTFGNTYFPVSDFQVCDTFFNKQKANDWFIENNFPVPHQDVSLFPLIAKPIFGSASQGIQKLNNAEEFTNFFTQHDIRTYLVQQFINGDEFTVDCFVDKKGDILSIVPRKRIETSGGEVTQTLTQKEEEISNISEQILQKANLIGPITIQFLKDKNGVFLMEINPRFGGGVIASIEAGADAPMFILKDYLGLKNEKVLDWQSNLLMMRANREFFKIQ